jgi:RNA polymerase sigma-70 factor (ECF subfamily)
MNIENIYREESGRILATLIRLLGSFDLAEEALQEAFAVALEQWPKSGMPANPRAWLVSTAHHKAVDLLRRRARFDSKREELQRLAALEQQLADADENMRRGQKSGDPPPTRLRERSWSPRQPWRSAWFEPSKRSGTPASLTRFHRPRN